MSYVSNSKLEDLHASPEPMTRDDDYSDVFVDAEGCCGMPNCWRCSMSPGARGRSSWSMPATPVARSEAMQASIPGAALEALDGKRHLAQLEAPGAIAAALVRLADRFVNRAAGGCPAVAQPAVSVLDLRPGVEIARQHLASFGPSSFGGAPSAFGWKLLIDAQLLTSVPSTEK